MWAAVYQLEDDTPRRGARLRNLHTRTFGPRLRVAVPPRNIESSISRAESLFYFNSVSLAPFPSIQLDFRYASLRGGREGPETCLPLRVMSRVITCCSFRCYLACEECLSSQRRFVIIEKRFVERSWRRGAGQGDAGRCVIAMFSGTVFPIGKSSGRRRHAFSISVSLLRTMRFSRRPSGSETAVLRRQYFRKASLHKVDFSS